MSKEQLDKLNSISKKSSWISDAKKRRRNWWWKKHWNKIHFKYLRLKRKLKQR